MLNASFNHNASLPSALVFIQILQRRSSGDPREKAAEGVPDGMALHIVLPRTVADCTHVAFPIFEGGLGKFPAKLRKLR